jgi:hypothetical protein
MLTAFGMMEDPGKTWTFHINAQRVHQIFAAKICRGKDSQSQFSVEINASAPAVRCGEDKGNR